VLQRLDAFVQKFETGRGAGPGAGAGAGAESEIIGEEVKR
jgi:hypothetical protein